MRAVICKQKEMNRKIIMSIFLLAALVAGFFFFGSADATKAKKTKKQYKKVYSFSVQGDCTNADADIVWDSDDADEHSLFRKIAVPEVKLSNMPKFEFFENEGRPYSGYSGEMWQPVFSTSYYFTDGYIWFRYGGYDSDSPNDGCSSASELRQFRFFVY
jgi:hypothetical protein